jgi:hypothetical protein
MISWLALGVPHAGELLTPPADTTRGPPTVLGGRGCPDAPGWGRRANGVFRNERFVEMTETMPPRRRRLSREARQRLVAPGIGSAAIERLRVVAPRTEITPVVTLGTARGPVETPRARVPITEPPLDV